MGHVVKEWAGHADLDTTDRYYLQVSEAEYERAASERLDPNLTKLLTKLGKKGG